MLTVLVLVYRPLPTIDGEYRLLGIEQRAQVDRDSFGVPHVWAQNAHDLFYLQGYVTAQDRLFQMDLYRRAAAGRLSEVLGEPTIDADKAMRTLGFARIAGQELDIARPDTRSALEAYAQGVNKFLEQHGDSLPIEFGILGYRPYLWTATDTILVGKLQAFDAAGNQTQEVLRADIALRLGTGALATLMPDPSGAPASVDERAWAAVAPLLSATERDRGLASLRARNADEPVDDVPGLERGPAERELRGLSLEGRRDDRSVPRDRDVEDHRSGASLHPDLLARECRGLERSLVFVAARIARIRSLDEEVLRVRVGVRQAPGDAVVVSDQDRRGPR